jgi:DNA mismatch endonuclease, patch repair protein
MSKTYSRDKRSPKPLNDSTSKVMSANKAKNTKPEIMLRKALWAKGYNGYRLNWKRVPGRPDIAYPGKKIAIFVNGCYWHRCSKCDLPIPKTNTEFWKDKFNKNVERDKKKSDELLSLDWIVLVFWECDIKSNISNSIQKIKKVLDAQEKESTA